MPKPKSRGPSVGRVTPKGGVKPPPPKAQPAPSGRYTPPVPREFKQSRLWVPILMFTLLAAGALLIILNYTPLMPGGSSNWWLLVGLGLITAGFVVATNYR